MAPVHARALNPELARNTTGSRGNRRRAATCAAHGGRVSNDAYDLATADGAEPCCTEVERDRRRFFHLVSNARTALADDHEEEVRRIACRALNTHERGDFADNFATDRAGAAQFQSIKPTRRSLKLEMRRGLASSRTMIPRGLRVVPHSSETSGTLPQCMSHISIVWNG